MQSKDYLEDSELSERSRMIEDLLRSVFPNDALIRLSSGCLDSTSLSEEEKEILQEVGFPDMEIIGMFVDLPGGYPKIIEPNQDEGVRWIYLNVDNGYAVAISDNSGEIFIVNCDNQEPHSYVAKGIFELLEVLAIVREGFDQQEGSGPFDFDEFVEKLRHIDERMLDSEVSFWAAILEEMENDIF